MTSRNWRRRFALACAAISLLAAAPAPSDAAAAPAVTLLDSADAAQWQAWTRELGWRVIVPAATGPQASIDQRVLAAVAAVENAVKAGETDAARVYLVGRGGGSAGVFYGISRAPDVWAAGLAIGGGPQAALDSNRIFTANFTQAPVLWISAGADDAVQAKTLASAGLNVEWRPAASTTMGAGFEWLARRAREEFPSAVDCETNSPQFARCWWIRMTKFDAAERNDVLPSSALRGGSGAALDLGGFGYNTTDPGPGVLVSVLPPKYDGPLKMGDRIVALDGKEIADARTFSEFLAGNWEEKGAVVLVARGKDRVRLETRIVLPRRDPVVTARVQGKYIPEDKVIQIVSRTATEMRVTVPPAWVPGSLYWNGLGLEKIETPGCYALAIEKELLRAAPCGK